MATDTDVPMSARAAKEIRALLGWRDINKSELARRLGVSHTWVTNRLTGDQEIGLNDLQRIATVLGVDVADLLPPRDTGLPASSPVDAVGTLHPRVIAAVGTPRSRRGRAPVPTQRAVRTGRRRDGVGRRPVTPVPA